MVLNELGSWQNVASPFLQKGFPHTRIEISLSLRNSDELLKQLSGFHRKMCYIGSIGEKALYSTINEALLLTRLGKDRGCSSNVERWCLYRVQDCPVAVRGLLAHFELRWNKNYEEGKGQSLHRQMRRRYFHLHHAQRHLGGNKKSLVNSCPELTSTSERLVDGELAFLDLGFFGGYVMLEVRENFATVLAFVQELPP